MSWFGWRCVFGTIRYIAAFLTKQADNRGESGVGRKLRGDVRDMQSLPLVRHILRDEAVTRGLGDIEASIIVDWLAGRAERIAANTECETRAWQNVRLMCRRARVISCFVRLWTSPQSRGSAMQLIANERLHWPLPQGDIDPGDLMLSVLTWVDRQDEIVEESFVRHAA